MLQLVFGSPKGSRPKVGDIYLMRTSRGYVPIGIVYTESFFGSAVTAHPYKAIIQDPEDTSYYPLIHSNELLLPPLLIAKRDFKKGGQFLKVTDKNTPQAIPFEIYFEHDQSTAWNPEEQFFDVPAETFPGDRLWEFIPAEERKILAFRLDHDQSQAVPSVNEAPEGAYISAATVVMDCHLEFALEDALAYHGLIDAPRPLMPVVDRETQLVLNKNGDITEQKLKTYAPWKYL